MEFPVRCFSCGAVIGDLYEQYKVLTKEKGAEVALNDLGLERYCCRRMFIAHVDITDKVSKYPRI